MGSENWTRENLAWLAALLEGEGTFTASKRSGSAKRQRFHISIKMTDEDVIRRAHLIAGCGRVYGPKKVVLPSGKCGKDAWTWSVQRSEESYALAAAVYQWLFERRRGQARAGMIAWINRTDERGSFQSGHRNQNSKLSEEAIAEIRRAYNGRRFRPGQRAELAERFDCDPHAIWAVATGRSYK